VCDGGGTVVVVVAEHPPFQVEERGKGIFLVNAVQ
jgi:hypothetical protein